MDDYSYSQNTSLTNSYYSIKACFAHKIKASIMISKISYMKAFDAYDISVCMSNESQTNLIFLGIHNFTILNNHIYASVNAKLAGI